ncbi:MAG: alpha/beta hydrolase [Mycetocola sp.]
MTDLYWERLLAKYTELTQLGAEHPSAIFPDPSLRSLLEDPVDGEADYMPPSVLTQDLTLGVGAESFQIRVYTPHPSDASGSARALFVWLHGGAWAFGDLEGGESDAAAREVAARGGVVVISVDYRLARSGVHFPVPLDDVIATYRWAVAHSEELGIDPVRIVLGGASAGGNLAAGAVLRMADEGDVLPVSLVLAYPTLHGLLPPASAELQERLDRMSAASGFAPEILTPIVENYLGGPAGTAHPYAMPGGADDLSVFPSTYIFNCEFDGLRASGERFAEQLREAGVEVRCETVSGVGHGHLARPGLPQARQSHADLAAWVSAKAAVPV